MLVKGGLFLNNKSNLFGKKIVLSDFYISKYEVTQKEWIEVMGENPSEFKGENLPVEMVNWYDCIKYCNKRSSKEGLKPYYTIDKIIKGKKTVNNIDSINWKVKFNKGANGYRLPTEGEWEYAAGGGQLSKNYIYSGSNNIDDVAWYWRNSGDTILTGEWFFGATEKKHCKTKPVGSKKPNELGLYDMSGNVREWCRDMHEGNEADDPHGRVWRGGGWIGADFCCESFFRAVYHANGKGSDQGFRLCRNK